MPLRCHSVICFNGITFHLLWVIERFKCFSLLIYALFSASCWNWRTHISIISLTTPTLVCEWVDVIIFTVCFDLFQKHVPFGPYTTLLQLILCKVHWFWFEVLILIIITAWYIPERLRFSLILILQMLKHWIKLYA